MRIDVWADLVCPWCGLGKYRLDAALARMPDGKQVQVVYRSYQLDPYAPAKPRSVRDLLRSGYGLDDAGFASVTGRVERLAAAEGLVPYHVGDNVTGNTALAHELLALAAERGLSETAWNRLYRAHFGERRSIFDVESLAELGWEIGLDPATVQEALASRRYSAQVDADVAEGRGIGVTGVPFFLIDGRYGICGAQPPEVLLQLFQQVRAAAGV